MRSRSKQELSVNSDSSALPIYKVVVAGDGNVGKTSLVRRYCEGKFEASRITTLGVDFQTKVVTVGDQTIKLSIWDVAGQDRFVSFRDTFYRGAHAVALVYDVTSPATFFNLMHWRDEIQSRPARRDRHGTTGSVRHSAGDAGVARSNMPFL
jgi:GTPase SAR1 family protein